MIDPKDFPEKPVKETSRQHSLPETYEMKAKWQALEILLFLYSLKNAGGGLFRFQNRENLRFNSVEHSGIDEIRGHSGYPDLALHLLELDSHRLGPADHCPLAGHIDRELRNTEHAGCRGYVADVAGIASEHIRKDVQGHQHRGGGIDVHGEIDVSDIDL